MREVDNSFRNAAKKTHAGLPSIRVRQSAQVYYARNAVYKTQKGNEMTTLIERLQAERGLRWQDVEDAAAELERQAKEIEALKAEMNEYRSDEVLLAKIVELQLDLDGARSKLRREARHKADEKNKHAIWSAYHD